MSTEPASTTVLEIVEPEQEITALVQSTGLQPEVAASLHQSFAPLFTEARGIIEKSRGINVTDVSQKLQMRIAREYRLALRKIRTTGDATRKALKEESMRRGKAIDGFFNILVHLTDSEETRLAEAEQFALRKEEERRAKLKADREEALKPYGLDTSFMDLGAMPDATFTQLLENSRAAFERAKEEARKIEQAKIEAENARLKEEARIREENLRLKKEAEEREAAAKAEVERLAAIAAEDHRKASEALRVAKEKAEAERKRIQAENDAKLAAERQKAAEEAFIAKEQAELAAKQAKADAAAKQAALEAQMRADAAAAQEKAQEAARKAKIAILEQQKKAELERKAREKAEGEAKALREAKEAEEAEKLRLAEVEAEKARAAALAPDRQKLTVYVAAVRALHVPNLNSGAGKLVAEDLTARLEAFAAYCERKAATL